MENGNIGYLNEKRLKEAIIKLIQYVPELFNDRIYAFLSK